MTHRSSAVVALLALVLFASPVSADAVPRWDPGSPQRLIRIEGALFQEHAGRRYPVSPDRVTARLGEGVADWETLVEQAIAKAPATFGVLAQLRELRSNRLGVVDLAIPAGGDPAAWAELIWRSGLARYAEVVTLGEYVAAPTDPRYGEQWGLANSGQSGGTPGADIDAERAWDLVTGDASIVVAVLDSGTDIDHEDLAANTWHNPGEIPGNGLDDDGNGFVDDWEGWDFDGDDNDPRPSFYHGTFVTGVVNAVGGNGLGIAGVAGGLDGTGGVLAMALNVGNSSPNSAAVDDAILYAADNGADVITLSLSVGPSQAIDDALDYAYNTRDVFIDCAAGNNGSSVAYPADRPEAMAVGATANDDTSSWFSNPGPEVEVAAPGSGILSTNLGNTYSFDDGTSFAAPAVAGLAALIYSRNPGMTASQVRQLIIDTAEDVDAPGFDERTGYGRINAYEALLRAATSDGAITLDAEAYACSDVVEVTVSDIDLAGTGSLVITVTSDSESAGETLSLTESGTGGVFTGSIPAETGTPADDGVLQVDEGDTIVAEYVDADDGAGGSDVVKTGTAAVDCSPPWVDGVGTIDLSDVTATVIWDTDEPGTSVVRYGTTAPPSSSASRSGLVTTHAVTFGGLLECTTYLYEVESSDGWDNAAIDNNGGAYHAFETYRNLPETGPVPCHQGQVLFDRTDPYGCHDSVEVTVIDIDLDTDPAAVETVDVWLTSSTETEGEWVTLTEIDPSNSHFRGTIALDPGAATTGDGVLSVGPGDRVTATYHDADDGVQGAYVAVNTTTTDCSGPRITDVRVAQITATRAVVYWTTDEPADSTVEFGPTAALGSVAGDPVLVTSHSVPISPFDACQRAHFRVSSTDINGNTTSADAGGAPYGFDTRQVGGLVWFEEFESDSGWVLEGEWERGTPQGLGSTNADPVGAWSGSFVIGNDLGGQGVYPGDYEPAADEVALSPPFSTRQQRDLELIIRRRLGVTGPDDASVAVVTSGRDVVWTSGGSFYDSMWVQQRIDIGAFADNKSSVQLEFRLQSNDAGHSYGWNVDEIIVKDSTQPDYLACGGCAGAPAFAGVASVTDPDPCGSGGLRVSWPRAASWGTGTGGTYEVYRGTTASFVPDASNRVAAGLTATSWTDASAPVGSPVWYVVRARNDESCSADGGLDDGNLIRLGATETTAQPLPTPVGNTLVATPVGDAHVRLSWAAVPGAASYRVRRATQPDFSDATDVGTAIGTVFEDEGAATLPGFLGYRIFAVDACGREQ